MTTLRLQITAYNNSIRKKNQMNFVPPMISIEEHKEVPNLKTFYIGGYILKEQFKTAFARTVKA